MLKDILYLFLEMLNTNLLMQAFLDLLITTVFLPFGVFSMHCYFELTATGDCLLS